MEEEADDRGEEIKWDDEVGDAEDGRGKHAEKPFVEGLGHRRRWMGVFLHVVCLLTHDDVVETNWIGVLWRQYESGSH